VLVLALMGLLAAPVVASQRMAENVNFSQRVPLRHINQQREPTDPNTYGRNLAQRQSFTDSMREKVNPCAVNYGRIFSRWQDAVVQNTIATAVWWAGMIAFFGLLCALIYLWWQYETAIVQQACFSRAAAVLIGQRNTAHKQAQNAINLHNSMVDRYDSMRTRIAEEQSAMMDAISPAQQQLPLGTGSTPVVENQENGTQQVSAPANDASQNTAKRKGTQPDSPEDDQKDMAWLENKYPKRAGWTTSEYEKALRALAVETKKLERRNISLETENQTLQSKLDNYEGR
jgi:hypothetical protein